MKQGISIKFVQQFRLHIRKFIEEFNLLKEVSTSDYQIVLSVSGGIDSMVLLDIFCKFKQLKFINNFSVIHFDHGTQTNQIKIEKMLTQLSKDTGFELMIKRTKLKLDQSNFEQNARLWRKKEYKLLKKSLIIQAHHIDDSFEWVQMKQYSASHASPKGIPVKNGKIRRPFNCVTKDQIIKYAQINKLSYFSDASNQNISFDRNYLRKFIIPKIKERYPKYLKHFVHQQNSLIENFVKEVDELNIQYSKEKDYAYFFSSKSHTKQVLFIRIRECITNLSSAKRGVLHVQINKMINAASSGKQGPFSFSGGVFGYLFGSTYLFFTKQSISKLDQNCLEKLAQNHCLLPKPLAVVSLTGNKNVKVYSRIAHFLPQTAKVLEKRNQGICFQ